MIMDACRQTTSIMRPKHYFGCMSLKAIRKLLWFVVVILTLTSIGLVIRRILIILHVIPAIPPGARFSVETGLQDYPLLTLLHILPGLIFVLTGPMLLRTPGFRKNVRLNWLFSSTAFILGMTAIAMPVITLPIGGVNEAAASMLFGFILLLETTQFSKAIVQNNTKAHHDWLLRMVALGLAIATTRPVMVLGFIAGHLSAPLFLGTAFWISFTVHLCVAETWIYYSSVSQKQHGHAHY